MSAGQVDSAAVPPVFPAQHAGPSTVEEIEADMMKKLNKGPGAKPPSPKAKPPKPTSPKAKPPKPTILKKPAGAAPDRIVTEKRVYPKNHVVVWYKGAKIHAGAKELKMFLNPGDKSGKSKVYHSDEEKKLAYTYMYDLIDNLREAGK